MCVGALLEDQLGINYYYYYGFGVCYKVEVGANISKPSPASSLVCSCPYEFRLIKWSADLKDIEIDSISFPIQLMRHERLSIKDFSFSQFTSFKCFH